MPKRQKKSPGRIGSSIVLRLNLRLFLRLLGVHRRTGYKCGQWWDVGWYEKAIAPYDPEPAPPRSVRELPTGQVSAVLRRAEAL